ncbi:MAG: GNAT family N-acetyltransferase [Clostridia bacterium]|nr:GNAT family N-acetyltransferase [Clostridia bacterium]
MGALPQLFMRQPDITNLPPLALPEGFSLHSHIEGQDKNWEDLIEKAFGSHFSFNDFIVNGGGYKPEYVLYIAKDGVDIATATAVEKDIFPGEGWFRMIGTAPEARGLGAGRLVCLAALHSLAARGYKSVVLSTDDARIPAIKLYLSLGFEPIFTHESHEERWKKVMENINNK